MDADETEVRVRRGRGSAHLTVKQGSGLSRVEVEIELDDSQFASLWPLTAGRRIWKDRHRVPLDGGQIEIDTYRGELAGLVVAEVEFASEQEAGSFKAPAWFGDEVTGNPRYLNKNLATRGLPEDVRQPEPSVGEGPSPSPRDVRGLKAVIEHSESERADAASPPRPSLRDLGAELRMSLEGLDQDGPPARLEGAQRQCIGYGAAAISAAASMFRGDQLVAQVRPTKARIARLVEEQEIDRDWMQSQTPIADWGEVFWANHRGIVEHSSDAGRFDRLIVAAGLTADLHDWLARLIDAGTATAATDPPPDERAP